MRAKYQLLPLLAVALITCGVMVAQDDPVLIPISEDRPALEFVGQFITNGPGAGVSSQQFGYLSEIRGLGLNQIFAGSTHNETTAMFTFYSQAATVSAIANGVVRIVHRVGTTPCDLHGVRHDASLAPRSRLLGLTAGAASSVG